MAWIVEDRRVADFERREEPYLTEALKQHLTDKYIPRYPTKRAVLLPALHLVQHTYNWIPMQALEEVAAFLEISPAEALDTASFYEEYWLKPKGKYLVGVCRSLACEICGSREITERLKRKLGVEVGETTADGRFTLIEMECLGSCGTAPVALVNEVLAEEIDPAKLEQILDRLPGEPEQYKDPTIDWEEKGVH